MLYESDGRGMSGPDILGLQQAVAKELSDAETFGEGYGIDCLSINLKDVNDDIAAGRIEEPLDFEGWRDAIVREYRRNFYLMPPEVRDELEKWWKGRSVQH